MIPGGKENDRARQSVFCTVLNPFGKDPEEEPRNFDYNVPQKQYYETHWKRNQDAIFLCKIVKSAGSRIAILADIAIITYTTVQEIALIE